MPIVAVVFVAVKLMLSVVPVSKGDACELKLPT